MMAQQEFENSFLERSGDDRGFSLIEMLIAIVVITFGLVSVVGISAYVSRTNSMSASLNVLAAAAQDQVDRLRTARWTTTFTDPMLSVGGAVPSVAGTPLAEPRVVSMAQGFNPGLLLFTASPSQTPTPVSYTYTLDPENPHHATASGTPIGDLNLTWQVREGASTNLRYATINVVQVGASGSLSAGFTVTTIIVRN